MPRTLNSLLLSEAMFSSIKEIVVIMAPTIATTIRLSLILIFIFFSFFLSYAALAVAQN
jgi:hypothetical protein